MFLFCLVFAMFCARLFICASWSPAGKGLTSWLSFVVSSVTGLPRSGKKFWKMKNFPGQGKVRELHFQSGKIKKNEKSHGKVMEKSGNFKFFLKRC